MKNKILSLSMIASYFTFAQVGIGTNNPEATLDIKSLNAINPIKINDSNSTNIFLLDNNGSINLNSGAFMPNNDPGSTKMYLSSNGSNTAPSWRALDTDNFIFNAFLVNQNKYTNLDNSSGTYTYLKYNTDNEGTNVYTDNESIANVGELLNGVIYNTSENISYFKIAKDGIYNISWNIVVDLGEYSISAEIPYGDSNLYYGSGEINPEIDNFYIAKANTSTCESLSCNQFYNGLPRRNATYYNSITIYLNQHDHIFLNVKSYQVADNIDRLGKIIYSSLNVKKINL